MVTHALQCFVADFLLLVGNVTCFAGVTHAIPFDCFSQYNGRLPLMMKCRMIGSIYFVRVVSAAVQPPNVAIGHIGNHGFEFGIFPKKVLADVAAAVGAIGLIIAI